MGPRAPRLRRPPRVVLDTNVLVSALVFGGQRWALLRAAWQNGRVVPLVGRETTEELLRVLAYPKFKLARAERESLLADYLPYAKVVKVPAGSIDLPAIRDPVDTRFLELALAGKADVLVSGDADVLEVRAQWTRILIMTPTEFLEWMEQEKA